MDLDIATVFQSIPEIVDCSGSINTYKLYIISISFAVVSRNMGFGIGLSDKNNFMKLIYKNMFSPKFQMYVEFSAISAKTKLCRYLL